MKDSESAGLVGTVKEVFVLRQRGRVLVLAWGESVIAIRPGDSVEIRMPGGRTVATHLAGVETRRGGDPGTVGVLLPKDLDAVTVPAGSELWKTA